LAIRMFRDETAGQLRAAPGAPGSPSDATPSEATPASTPTEPAEQ